MITQQEKAKIFKELHNSENKSFIMPNAWDNTSAKLISSSGFQALGSSSSAFALSKGVPDNSLSLKDTLENLSEIVNATSLPVSADFGYGFADDPDNIYNSISSLIKTGVISVSIEDVKNGKVYPLEIAKEKLAAAVAASREVNFPFTITARADNFFIGKTDLKNTITRLQTFQEAGADILYAPGLTTKEQISTVLANIDRPLNVLVGFPNLQVSIPELKDMGVKRLSLGAALIKQSYTAILNALEGLQANNTDILNANRSFDDLMKNMKSNNTY